MSVHNLCKLNYPLYCCAPFEAKSIFVGGGGGELGPRTGVPNVVELLELEQNRSEVMLVSQKLIKYLLKNFTAPHQQ